MMGKTKNRFNSPLDNLSKWIHEIIEENIYRIPKLKWMDNEEYEEYITKIEKDCLKRFLESKIRYYETREIRNEVELSIKKDIIEILGNIDKRFLNVQIIENTRLIGNTQKLSLIELLQQIKNHSVYTYVLLKIIGYKNERKDDKKYIVWIKGINRPDGNEINKQILFKSEEKITEEDIRSISEIEYPFSEKEIGINPTIPKPKPKKVFTDVNNNILPSKEPNSQIREIREQLTSTSHSDLITCEKEDYTIEVEKGDNKVNYYLYNPDEYWSFSDSLKQPLLEICKQWNDEEYFNLNKKLQEWKNKDTSTTTKNYIIYLNEVIGEFHRWYEENEVKETPDYKNNNLEVSDVQYTSNRIKYDTIHRLVSNLGIDITEKVKKENKKGNRKWKHTEGEILIKIQKGLGDNLTTNQKNTAKKHIQKVRAEMLKGQKKKQLL